ncbi:hypothetical protein [Peribacillus asahii]|uniref:Uncharacterized protein n=1 Tax=Peribacillus asahii TaxID=228899 RepID=A0A3Q9RQX2_9BACI|nr:hypothetical protein [Peribacillus asahii]AZV44591.1 hypothetical protein BAOM_3982 [Peribacillus asahii]USK84265.1 hypothetical protein LIT35_17800 [Peribacillus asahii]
MVLIFSVIIAILFLALLFIFLPLNLTLKGKVILFLASVCTSLLGLAMMNQVSIWGAIAVQLFFAIVLAYLITKRLALFQENEDESNFREKELQPLFRYEELLEKANLSNTVDQYGSPSFIKKDSLSSPHFEAETSNNNLSDIGYGTPEEPEFIDLEAQMAQEKEESQRQLELEEVAFMVEDELELIDREGRVAEEKEEDRSQFVLEETAATLEDELDFIDMKARMLEEQEEDEKQTSFEIVDESNDFIKIRMKMFEELDEIQELSDDGRKNEEIEIEEKQTIADSAEKDEDTSPSTNLHSFEDLEESYLKNKQKKDRETV